MSAKALRPIVQCFSMLIFPMHHREGSRFYCWLSWLKFIKFVNSVAYTWRFNLKHHHSITSFHHSSPFTYSYPRLHSVYQYCCTHSFIHKLIYISFTSYHFTIHIYYITYIEEHMYTSQASHHIDYFHFGEHTGPTSGKLGRDFLAILFPYHCFIILYYSINIPYYIILLSLYLTIL